MLGVAIRVVSRGEPTGTYHWETEQEDFVLSGEGLLIVEGQERPLRKWDFVHCPPRTRHAFVGAGTSRRPALRQLAAIPEGRALGPLPRDETAARHNASAPEDTQDTDVADVPVQLPPGRETRTDGLLPD